MKRTTIINEENQLKVSTYGLTEEQHNLAVKGVKENLRKVGGYKLKDIDRFVFEDLYEDTEDGDYKDFLEIGTGDAEEVLSLVDVSGGFEQVIGEVIVH